MLPPFVIVNCISSRPNNLRDFGEMSIGVSWKAVKSEDRSKSYEEDYKARAIVYRILT